MRLQAWVGRLAVQRAVVIRGIVYWLLAQPIRWTARPLKIGWLASQALTYPPGSTNRLIYIAAFAVSGYASTKGRTSKPFNPLLGETFELVHQQKVRGTLSMHGEVGS